jgi:hypothetical protein
MTTEDTGSATRPALFTPIRLRSLDIEHRGWVAAMCQYSCDAQLAPGVPNDWHLMHLGQFAAGGAAMIITEATAVNPEARISPRDAGLYNADQVEAWRRIVDFRPHLRCGQDQDRSAAGTCRTQGVDLLAVQPPPRLRAGIGGRLADPRARPGRRSATTRLQRQ